MEEVGNTRLQSQEVTVGCDIDMTESMEWSMSGRATKKGASPERGSAWHLQRFERKGYGPSPSGQGKVSREFVRESAHLWHPASLGR